MLLSTFVEAAARTAYLAAFHAAQALIFDRTSRVLKTHNGVHTEFARLVRNDESFGPTLRVFLSRASSVDLWGSRTRRCLVGVKFWASKESAYVHA